MSNAFRSAATACLANNKPAGDLVDCIAEHFPDVEAYRENDDLIIKGGSDVGSHLQLLQVYFPGYSVTFGGSVIGFVYTFVLGYLSGRTLALLYHRLAAWIG